MSEWDETGYLGVFGRPELIPGFAFVIQQNLGPQPAISGKIESDKPDGRPQNLCMWWSIAPHGNHVTSLCDFFPCQKLCTGITFPVDEFWRGLFWSKAYRLAQCPREESKNGRPHLWVENRQNVDFRPSLDSRFLPVAPQALVVEKNVLYLKCRQYIGLKLCRQKFFYPRFGSSARVDFRQTRLFCKNGFLPFLLV